MTVSDTPPEDDRIDQASAWVARLHGEDADEADWLALETWLTADPGNARAFDEAERLWAALGVYREPILAGLSSASRQRSPGPAGPAQDRGPRSGWRRWSLAAAPIAAALVAGVLLVGPMIEGRATTYVTRPGETREVVLEDGTIIALNGGSRLTVRQTSKARAVEMGQAEAAFDVAHDPSRPFLVTVGESQVRVVGTAFNIRRDGVSTRVAVSRGVVQVGDVQDPGQVVRLTAGETVSRDDASDVSVVTRGDAETAQGWRSGRLVYVDRPLSDVVADLNRAFAIPVTVAPDAASLRFTGILELGDEDRVIARLEGFMPVAAYRTAAGVEIRAR